MSSLPTRAIGTRPAIDPWRAGALILATLVALPIMVVVASLAVPNGEVLGHLAATVLPRYVMTSLWLMLGVGVGVIALGTGTAWLVTMTRFPGVGVFAWTLLLPLAMPAYIIAYAYAGMFDYAGPVQSALRAAFGWGRDDYWFPQIRSLGGAIAMLTLVLYPYVYLLARAAFLDQSAAALEASRVLGRGPWRRFFHVALPLARPAIVAGAALALMETVSDFGTVQHFGLETFTTGIYRTWLGQGEPLAAAQLAAMMLIFVFALIAIERHQRGDRCFAPSGTRRPVAPARLRGIRALAAFVVCAAPIVLGFLVPAAQLAAWVIESPGRLAAPAFWRQAMNSLILAGLSALVIVAGALFIGYAMRLKRDRLVAGAARVAAMGYALPGPVIAVGVMIPFAAFDNALDDAMRGAFGLSTGLLLSGTLVAVMFGHLVRFLAIALNSIEAALARITPAMDAAARTLGASPWGTLRRVHLPLIRGGLLAAAILVFVDVMKELPATLIMRPFNFDTLAIRAYQLASDERLREAAPAALAIVLVGLAPVLILARGLARGRAAP